ncbi:bifunctional glutamate/proline--tRNA ligase-like [Ornithodoros turicata]|uniref:bifunctional glutamate/proline--tRNA ligase-like n=1 Tax=Ornithodoros turicata TaxID=34597 RepID=UPI00313A0469
MHLKLTCNTSDPPLVALLALEFSKPSLTVKVDWGKSTCLNVDSGKSLVTPGAIARYFARLAPSSSLYGDSLLQRSEVDHWLELSGTEPIPRLLQRLNQALATATYLVGHQVTLADLSVWGTLYSKGLAGKLPENVSRWYNFLLTNTSFQSVIKELPDAMVPAKQAAAICREEGKFVELPGAKMGEVVVRFPPEASGYLHIGHAKAALLNQYYQRAFEGRLILRFDDTNPDKEREDFEQVIMEDVKMLEIHHDRLTFTSDYFDLMLQKCQELIQKNLAYVDDTEPDVMKSQREQKQDSVNRNNTIERNLALWQEMQQGTPVGLRCCVRAKISMQAANGCMRDPTLYRCKNMVHPRTGNRYHVYPTYDFACPIVDSIEGVTHALRTTEYHDRDEQYFWVLDALGMRKPHIYEYSRLNLMHTVLSKRKLTWFVDTGVVDGWDDPRMPTVRGVLRRGMTVEALRQFIAAQGSSRSVVMMDWDKLWAFNKKVVDPVAPRHVAVEQGVPVTVSGLAAGTIRVAWHPKNAELGDHEVDVGPELLVDRVDADSMAVGSNVTFIGLGNLRITDVRRDAQGAPVAVLAETNLEDRNYKNTLKVTWLCSSAELVPCTCIFFDHIISKAVLSRDDDFKQFVSKDTRLDVPMQGDPLMKRLRKGDIVQVQRKGYFICDQPYDPDTIRHVGKPAPLVLIFVPDGSQSISTLPQVAQLFYQRNKASVSAQEQNGPHASIDELSARIRDVGNTVRDLKSKKADKAKIDAAVSELLKLKGEYKALSGTEWKPETTASKVEKKKDPAVKEGGDSKVMSDPKVSASLQELGLKIQEKGNHVRELKSKKAEKSAIDASVAELLRLKAEYKAASGTDWKPESFPAQNREKTPSKEAAAKQVGAPEKGVAPAALESLNELSLKIQGVGDKVRELKSNKAEKSQIDAGVAELLRLKAEYKAASGTDWKPAPSPAQKREKTPSKEATAKEVGAPKKDSSPVAPESMNELSLKIQEVGNHVRELKSKKAEKSQIDAGVAELLRLKSEYKAASGKDWAPEGAAVKAEKRKAKAAPVKGAEVPKEKANDKESAAPREGPKKVTRLGLEARKEENLSEWYSQVITKSEMIEYYDVSGCYILRPWAYGLWENVRDYLDARIREMGVQNCYFPMFVSAQALEQEKAHVEDFAPEVAWVTRSGNSELAEPIAIRPTSETVMYPAYARWVQSHRDLPLQLNQWCNVVRWEFKHPQPFLRTREFLWQEGHSAFATKEEAQDEVYRVLGHYASVYEDLLAIPVVRGRKTEKEKFAGAELTTTVEAYVPASGRGIQAATSHYLGQNFSRMFEIVFEDPETREKRYVHQTSWGLTTRTIGVLVMVHADNQGLVLPPRVAQVQAVLVPCGITASLGQERKEELLGFCRAQESRLSTGGVRCRGDYRDNYSPGWKFNHWELKGVPVRLEVGPRDMEQNQVTAVRRDTGDRLAISTSDLVTKVSALLEDIQETLFKRAKEDQLKFQARVTSWDNFLAKLEEKCLILAPFCGECDCEDNIKKQSAREEAEPGAPAMGAKSLCIPFEQPAPMTAADRCIHPACTRKPQYYTLFGRSY